MRPACLLMLAASFCLSLATADDAGLDSNITNISSCAMSCLATFTHCPLNDTLCVCYDTRSAPKISNCLLEHCSLADGTQYEQVLSSSCNPHIVPSHQRLVLSVVLSLSGTAVLFILLRIPLQLFEYRKIFAEDWFLLLAGTAQAGFAALSSFAVFNGLGGSAIDVDSGVLRQALIFIFSVTPVYWLVLLLTRLSACLFLHRINPDKTYRIVALAMIVFVVTWGVLVIVLSVLQCRPISYNWDMFLDKDSGDTQGTCLNLDVLAISSNGISIFQDVLIFLLAIPILWIPRLTAGKRFGICLVLLVGLFVWVTAGLRLSSLIIFSNDSVDPTSDNVPIIIWSAVETSTGIMLVCLPILGRFFMKTVCGCLEFPEEFFESSSRRASKIFTGDGRTSKNSEKRRTRQSVESFKVNGVQYNFEVQEPERLTDAEIETIRLRNSQQALALAQAEALLTVDSNSREHLNRTYTEHERQRPAGPRTPPKRRGGKRLASPTQGIFRDTIWRSESSTPTPVVYHPLPPSWPLPNVPVSHEEKDKRLRPAPLRLSRNTKLPTWEPQRSEPILNDTETGTTPPSEPMGFPFPDSVRSPVSKPESWRKPHLSDAEDSRDLPRPNHSLRAKTNPTLQPRRPPPRPQQLSPMSDMPTASVYKQIILEQQDEDSEQEKEEVMKWPVPDEWAGKKSRIRRSKSGRAIVFNGQILQAN